MARGRAVPQRKKRTREHVIADLGVNRVEREVLLRGHTLERILRDYGIDATMQIHDAEGEREAGVAYFQVKATEQAATIQAGATVAFRVSRRDLQHWLAEPMPVYLALYDAARDVVCYLYVQRYFAALPGFNLFEAGQTVTVHIPATQTLDGAAVDRIASDLRHLVQRLDEGNPHG